MERLEDSAQTAGDGPVVELISLGEKLIMACGGNPDWLSAYLGP